MSSCYWDNKQLKDIEEKITDIERKTSGEIVVAIAKSSSDYLEFVYVVSFLVSLIISFLLMRFLPLILPESILKIVIRRPFDLVSEAGYIVNFGIPYFFGLTIFFFIIFSFFLSKFRAIISFLVSEKIKDENVRRRAISEFYINGVNKTIDKTGVLIFFSMFERRVYILADINIYNKINQEKLNAYALRIAKNMKKNKMEILEVLDDIGGILAANFPIKKDDTDELSNRVVILD